MSLFKIVHGFVEPFGNMFRSFRFIGVLSMFVGMVLPQQPTIGGLYLGVRGSWAQLEVCVIARL